MASKNRDYCCCCIPLRFAVTIISLIALGLGAVSVWSVIRYNITDAIPKIASYVIAGVYGLLGVSGLVSVVFKHYALAKNFSVLWWTVTIIVTILSIVNLVLIATREKEEVRGRCQTELIASFNDKYTLGSTTYDAATLADDVDTCYRWVLIVLGIATGVEVLVMSFCGWVASRYTAEVKNRKVEMGYTEGYGPIVSPPPPTAHPYTNTSVKY
ncbi:hypothetical protein BGW38_003627 [Lunasporangiospora selenospora]|uniref:Tetraspanin family protein n=1 Tax=Lunasporangiospora selenospora TaxID=979761 RepID=A0A9P6G3Q0_9FUNG|nr:hypothetical protein BGW38_003627 [Lunasporangiospora selenospora]